MIVSSSCTYISHLANGLFKRSCKTTFLSTKENMGHVSCCSEQTIIRFIFTLVVSLLLTADMREENILLAMRNISFVYTLCTLFGSKKNNFFFCHHLTYIINIIDSVIIPYAYKPCLTYVALTLGIKREFYFRIKCDYYVRNVSVIVRLPQVLS